MKVLVIEDDIQLNITICEFFKLKTFETASVKDGISAITKIDEENFDLYIIDINLPQVNGLDIVKYIRKTDLSTPIIMITASLEIENFSTAFENGCSEYIKKPFHLKELDIRVNNLLSLTDNEVIKLKSGLEYNLHLEVFLYENCTIELGYKEKRLCTFMIKNINTIVTNEMLHDYIWEGEIRENYPLRQLLLSVRKKLPYNLIENRIKKGYIIHL